MSVKVVSANKALTAARWSGSWHYLSKDNPRLTVCGRAIPFDAYCEEWPPPRKWPCAMCKKNASMAGFFPGLHRRHDPIVPEWITDLITHVFERAGNDTVECLHVEIKARAEQGVIWYESGHCGFESGHLVLDDGQVICLDRDTQE